MPLLTVSEPAPYSGRSSRGNAVPRSGVIRYARRFLHLVKTYGPAVVAVALILSAFPSIVVVTARHHWKTEGSVGSVVVHIAIASFLTFITFSSFIVCIAREPGPVKSLKSREGDVERNPLVPGPDPEGDEISLADALAGPSIGDAGSSDDESEIGLDDQGEPMWCKKCWAPKTITVRGWRIAASLGHRTYPSFLHFLLSTTLISAHAVSVSVAPLKWYFNNTVQVIDLTPLHALYLAFGGAIFTICMASFVGFHAYLVTTGQTTLEQLSPYMLLRYIPKASSVPNTFRNDDSGSSIESDVDLHTMLDSDPRTEAEDQTDSSLLSSSLPVYPPPAHSVPVASRNKTIKYAEHTMTRDQRRLVRSAAGKLRMYDLGWRRNWADVFAVRPERALLDWVEIVWWGGHGTRGDGRTFLRNPKAPRILARLKERLDNSV